VARRTKCLDESRKSAAELVQKFSAVQRPVTSRKAESQSSDAPTGWPRALAAGGRHLRWAPMSGSSTAGVDGRGSASAAAHSCPAVACTGRPHPSSKRRWEPAPASGHLGLGDHAPVAAAV
jgi:hypothetical protein